MDPSITPSVLTVASFFAGFLIAMLVVGLIGRAPIRLFAPILKLIALPFLPFVALLRALRILPKAGARVRAVRNAAVGATTMTDRGFGSETEIELALKAPDYDAEEAQKSYDFDEEERHLKRDGVVFRSIQIRSEFFPARLTDPLNDEVSDQYFLEAKRFFNHQVSLSANPKALYEDAEGAFIISLFRKNDRRCYYILNEMRKTVNGNARRLIFLFSAVLIGVCCAVIFLPALIGAAACAAAILVMFMWHNAGYQKQQQHNIRELRSFLTRYLGRISDRYREATGIARGVTVGDETDSKKLSEAAVKWHKIMMWMPFRTFFVECFVRDVLYQIYRNTTYYLFLWPIAAIGAIVAVGLAWAYGFGVGPDLSAPAFLLEIGVFIVAVLVYIERINKVVIAEELSQLDWLGYDNLNVSAAMDDVVGKYAEDVGFWKGRLDR